jgi:C-terminal processing protease CtpA/Prc
MLVFQGVLHASEPVLELVPVRSTKTGKVLTVVVVTVKPGSSAEKAGIKEGMFITSIQGMKVSGKTEKELIDDTAKIKWPSNNILTFGCRNSFADRRVSEIRIEVQKPSKFQSIAKL